MFFNRKQKQLKQIRNSFGQTKTEGFSLDLIKRYFNRKDHSNAFHVLSEQTCNDLDLDLFFCYIDRTRSKIGQQFLYNNLRTAHFSCEKMQHQEKVISVLLNDPQTRTEIEFLLSKLNSQQSYYVCDLFQQELDAKPSWFMIFPFLSFTALLSILLSAFNPTTIFIFVLLLPIHVILHYGLKRKTNLFLNAIPSLLSLGSVAKKLSKINVLKNENSELEVAISVISKIRRKMSFFKIEQKIDSDMEAAYWFLLELIKISFLLEPLLLFSSLDKLRNKSLAIEKVFEFIGFVDTCISVASLRSSEKNFCIPEVNVQFSHAQFRNFRHPLIPNCVPNTLSEEKSILLTGSNMSGKTTFIRAFGLNYISGMALNTCFAEDAVLPVAKLFSAIRIEDDLMNASSYFFREISEIKTIIEQSKDSVHSIILLDELFKGTNTRERIASAKGVLNYLGKSKNQVLVSTHDIELTQLLDENYELFYFSESISNGTIHFDYQLKKGIPSHGNAIRILELNDFPKEIIHEANTVFNNC